MALEESIDAADRKLDIDLSLLDLDEKSANEIAFDCSDEGFPKVFLMSISRSAYAACCVRQKADSENKRREALKGKEALPQLPQAV